MHATMEKKFIAFIFYFNNWHSNRVMLISIDFTLY
jgi:hypothetical protein